MGYKREDNKQEFDNQSKRIQENTDKIIETIKSKCNEANLKGEIEGEKNIIKHYELDSGLHVYIEGENVTISDKRLGIDKDGIIKEGDFTGIDRREKTNLNNSKDIFTSIIGKENAGALFKEYNSKKGTFEITTTAEHINYLEPEDENIFDLSENLTKRYDPQKREMAQASLDAFKEMIEKEIGEINKQVENKEPEKVEPEKIEPENIEPEKTEPEKEELEADNINRNDIEDERTKKIETIMKGIDDLDLSQEEIDKLTEYLKALKTRQTEENQKAQGKEQEDEQHGG